MLLLSSPSRAQTIHYSVTDLGTFGGSGDGVTVAIAINNSGQVTGYSKTASGEQHAFIYSDGVMTDLGALGGPNSSGFGINNLGEITGSADLSAGGFRHAFIYAGEGLQDIDADGLSSFGAYINNAGQVVGTGQFVCGSSDPQAEPFVYTGGVFAC